MFSTQEAGIEMRSRESLLALVAELDGDATELERVLANNRRAWERIQGGASDTLDWGSLAFTLHTAYGVLENYFLRISKYFENSLPPKFWHKALVEKMALDIPGLRPALLADPEGKRMVLELLKFRDRIRNLYGEDIDPGKTREIQGIAGSFFADFPAIHETFATRLRKIAEALG
jgi:hypothetical protein